MKRVGIIAKKSLSGYKSVFRTLNRWMEKKKLEVFYDEDTAEKLEVPVRALKWEEFSGNVDWIIVLGGDGTFLRVVRFTYGAKIPILGVNLGSLGFLTEIPLENMFLNLDCIIQGIFKVEERALLDVVICNEGKVLAEYYAMNEVVLTKKILSRPIRLEASINGLLINRFFSDGLILSTPTGSTAYSLSAGGPIVFPTLHVLILTPICPHTLSNCPIVLPDDGVIQISMKSEEEGIFLTVDGQIGLEMQNADVVKVRKAPYSALMIQPTDTNYYEILRSKLNWGKM